MTARIIVLLDPITNPRPDRRKKNWAGEKTFPAGRYIAADHYIYRAGGYRYHAVDRLDNKAGYEAIIAASSEVAPLGIKELLLTLGGEDWSTEILGVLLHNNLIAENQIRSALQQLDADEDLFNQV